MSSTTKLTMLLMVRSGRRLLASRSFFDWTAARSSLERHDGLWPLELARIALQDAAAQRVGHGRLAAAKVSVRVVELPGSGPGWCP